MTLPKPETRFREPESPIRHQCEQQKMALQFQNTCTWPAAVKAKNTNNIKLAQINPLGQHYEFRIKQLDTLLGRHTKSICQSFFLFLLLFIILLAEQKDDKLCSSCSCKSVQLGFCIMVQAKNVQVTYCLSMHVGCASHSIPILYIETIYTLEIKNTCFN